jgi:hypothetical protein
MLSYQFRKISFLFTFKSELVYGFYNGIKSGTLILFLSIVVNHWYPFSYGSSIILSNGTIQSIVKSLSHYL